MALALSQGFLINLILSSVIIYVATKLLGEQEGFGTAIVTAVIGAVISSVATYFLGTGWIAAVIGAIAWLIALGTLYGIGWIKSLIIAVVIWALSSLLSTVWPF